MKLRLLVEGGDDAYLLQHFLSKTLSWELKARKDIIHAIGIVVDADADPVVDRWSDLRKVAGRLAFG